MNVSSSVACTLFSLASFAVGLAFSKVLAIRQGRKDLEKLHDDLNKMKWIGADEGWDNAIKAVRTDIAARIKLKFIEEEEL
jgi:hypothetical protein